MENPEVQTALLVLLFGGVLVAALLSKAALQRLRVPPLVAYLVIGVLLKLGDEHYGILAADGKEVLDFLATLGVIALLFRIGLESDIPGLVRQLRSASFIWLGNVLISGGVGYLAARYLLSFEMLPSLVIATAMTATSVGIPARVWQSARALDTPDGERFLDVAELDDISGVVLMALLFSVLPVLHGGGEEGLAGVVATKAGLFALKLAAFAAACVLFSRFVEKRFTQFIRRIESGPDPMLVVVGVGLLVAAIAGVLGFSVAIGAFFAGLVFSRDPRSVKVDASFAPLHDLFTPFFFVGIGLAMEPGVMAAAAGVGAVLLVAAVAGKIIGTTAPALAYAGWSSALVLGVSMVPRAEIAMLIMHRAANIGPSAAPPSAYGGMVMVSAVTCLAAPAVLIHMLRRSGASRRRRGR